MPSISYYEQRVPQYFASDTTMVFLNGTHYLETLQPLVIKDIEIFIMIGSSGFTIGLEGLLEAKSKIECVVSGFNFINVSGIHITNLTFTYCGQEVASSVCAALAFHVAYNVNLSQVTVRNSSGFGYMLTGSLVVYRCMNQYSCTTLETASICGGNVHFWYGECPENNSAYLEVELSYFLHGYNTFKWHHSFNETQYILTPESST